MLAESRSAYPQKFPSSPQKSWEKKNISPQELGKERGEDGTEGKMVGNDGTGVCRFKKGVKEEERRRCSTTSG